MSKRLTTRHPAGARFVASIAGIGADGMRTYLDTLHAGGVRLPAELAVVAAKPLTVRHRWIPGPTLLDLAAHGPGQFVSGVAEVGTWIRALDSADARVDANLANFCLTRGRPVLIDVLPPLVPSRRPVPRGVFETLFDALCFDTPTVIDALAGYALRALVTTGGARAARHLLPVVRDLTHDLPAAEEFPAAWFRARRILATRAAEGRVPPERVREFFAATSVLRFRHLDEPARRLRIRQVARRIREVTS